MAHLESSDLESFDARISLNQDVAAQSALLFHQNPDCGIEPPLGDDERFCGGVGLESHLVQLCECMRIFQHIVSAADRGARPLSRSSIWGSNVFLTIVTF